MPYLPQPRIPLGFFAAPGHFEACWPLELTGSYLQNWSSAIQLPAGTGAWHYTSKGAGLCTFLC